MPSAKTEINGRTFARIGICLGRRPVTNLRNLISKALERGLGSDDVSERGADQAGAKLAETHEYRDNGVLVLSYILQVRSDTQGRCASLLNRD